MKQYIFYIILIGTTISCNNNSLEKCKDYNLKENSFLDNRIRILLPEDCGNTDSTFYPSKSNIYFKTLFSKDTSNLVAITVNDYSVYSSFDDNFEEHQKLMKGKIASVTNNDDSLIIHEVKKIGNYSVNFIHSFVFDKVKRHTVCWSNIFFIIEPKKFVEIDLKFSSGTRDVENLVNCVFESLRLK